MRIAQLVAGAALLVAALPAPAHAADPTFRASLVPERFVFGEPGADARLEIETGNEAETFEVSAFNAGIDFVDLDGRSGGGQLLGANCQRPRFEGPGTLGRSMCSVPGVPACDKTYLPTRHGMLGAAGSDEITVPAQTRTVLVSRLSHTSTAPWPNSTYGAGFRVQGGTLAEDRTVTSSTTPPAGRTGVRLAVTVEPAGSQGCERVPEVRGPVTVRGRSDRFLAGQEVILRYATEAEPQPRELARLRVADDGTFVFRDWRPKEPGLYEVAAAYVSQRPELTDDFSPPRAFRLAEPVPDPVDPRMPTEPHVDPDLTPPPVLVNRSLRVDREGRVRLRLFCPRGAPLFCSGSIRLRIGGRTVGLRSSVVVAREARRTIRVRLSRPARRRVARRRGVRATVRISDRPLVAVTLRPRR